ncbi:MAG: hemolysin family protein [Anaerolineae bacterium]|nr:hemolysin family protein [Anaerolineae bacterium]MDW8098295.1 hemolysin family protein [Anaerolineae bacterium]
MSESAAMEDLLQFLPRLLAVLVLVGANGFYVAAEFALVSVRRTRVEELIAQGNVAARAVRRAIDDPDRFIAATQLGITIASLALGWIGEPALAELLEPLFYRLEVPWAGITAHSLSIVLGFSLITFLHVVLGELAPKSVALAYPEATAFIVARPTIWTENLFRPFIWLLNGAGNLVLRLIGLERPRGHQLVHSVAELKMLVQASEEGGVLEKEEVEMLERVFDFSDRYVREVMIPRTEVVAIERTATLGEFLTTFARSQHSRFPVYTEDLDHVDGIISIKDVLTLLAQRDMDRSLTLEQLNVIRPVLMVPESRRIGDLFQEMRRTRTQMAVVIDEYGGTAGLVTLEELAEEIIGRMSDEWVEEETEVEPIGEGQFEVDAMLHIDEINAELGLGLPESSEYETLAGFLLYLLRRIPKVKDEVSWRDLRFTVLEMKGPKIERVLISRMSTDRPETILPSGG